MNKKVYDKIANFKRFVREKYTYYLNYLKIIICNIIKVNIFCK